MNVLPSRRKRRPLSGFGLIEVMVSGTLLLLGITAAVQMITHVDLFYRHQRIVAAAIHVCEGTMEELSVLYADNPKLTPGTHAGTGYSITGAPGGTFFATTWTVTPGAPIPGMRRVVVEVSWSEFGRARSIRLKTSRT